ncbi:cardiolipin synthase [Aquibacillus rhizosphaerae]|uniref:Cardiolipin synthase n=1 Tax=Aquibacillus rhizosphaerae TaxID=3051431 RepID=A0ABT7L041_9BACI|nr:cardiolipin synthase [Aquibacillus sp. LR5S19]MDL4839184.1 cardiolipin synthase [Aquibacillus sp. LR5S19]
MIPLTIILTLLVIIVLLVIDFHLGKRMYQNKAPHFDFGINDADYELFTNGNDLFSSYFSEIEKAKTSIDIMFFIVGNDNISTQLYHLLKQKVDEGVNVRLLVDYMGSFSLKRDVIKGLESNGVQFQYSDKPSFPYFFYKLNRRNHRKITVIDKQIGYFGGFNVGEEYLGKDTKFGPWRDYHLKVTGDVVNSLSQVFDYDWDSAKGQVITPTIERKSDVPNEDQALKLIVTESGQLEGKFVAWINQAKSEILIGSPYFIPSERMFEAIIAALNRGVEVNLLVPIKGDHPFVKPAAFPYYRKLLQAGGKGYLYTNGFYHAKVIIIDESFCDIGTANFDNRSVMLNKEINMVIDTNPKFVKEIREAFFKDMQASNSLTEQWMNKQPITTKLSGLIAACIKPLL